MRKLGLLALVLGLAALCAIVLRAGPGAVLAAMASVGWGFALVLLFRLVLVLAMGFAWYVLGADREDLRLRDFAWARLVRDSASECLPLSQIGGFVLGARALVVAGASGAFAAASTVVDVTLELLAQLLYLALGMSLLWRIHPEFRALPSLSAGIGLLTAGAFGFLLLQARGTVTIDRIARRALRSWASAATSMSAMMRELEIIHAARGRMIVGTAAHLATWLGNGAEAWVTLAFMGHPISLEAALIIDSLLYGLRSFAFVVPNALGVQEAGYVLLGGLFGLSPQTCLALSLLRRARDITLGLPALGAWQILEGRRLARSRSVA